MMNPSSKETGLFVACVVGTAAAQACGVQAFNLVTERDIETIQNPNTWYMAFGVATVIDLLLAVPLVAAAEVYERNRRRP